MVVLVGNEHEVPLEVEIVEGFPFAPAPPGFRCRYMADGEVREVPVAAWGTAGEPWVPGQFELFPATDICGHDYRITWA